MGRRCRNFRLSFGLTASITAVLAISAADNPNRAEAQIVRELGVVESSQVVEIRSPLQAVILSMAPDGASVKEGDLLVRLDSAALDEQLNQQKIVLATSKANVVRAEAAIAMLNIQMTAEKELAALRAKVANLSLKQFAGEGGEIDLKVKQAESEIKLASERSSIAQRLIARLKKRAASEQELAEAQLTAIEAREAKAVAEAELRWLNNHVRPTQTAALELAAKESEFALIMAKSKFQSQITQAEAGYQAQRAVMDGEREKLERIQEQIKSAAIRAPRDGVIQYATVRSRTGVVIEEGASVRERQSILRLADLDHLQLRVRVHESKIDQVKVGQPVVIRVDAFPDREFQGSVEKVNTYAEPGSFRSGNVKSYAVTVRIKNAPEGLKLGMTGMAEIATK